MHALCEEATRTEHKGRFNPWAIVSEKDSAPGVIPKDVLCEALKIYVEDMKITPSDVAFYDNDKTNPPNDSYGYLPPVLALEPSYRIHKEMSVRVDISILRECGLRLGDTVHFHEEQEKCLKVSLGLSRILIIRSTAQYWITYLL